VEGARLRMRVRRMFLRRLCQRTRASTIVACQVRLCRSVTLRSLGCFVGALRECQLGLNEPLPDPDNLIKDGGLSEDTFPSSSSVLTDDTDSSGHNGGSSLASKLRAVLHVQQCLVNEKDTLMLTLVRTVLEYSTMFLYVHPDRPRLT